MILAGIPTALLWIGLLLALFIIGMILFRSFLLGFNDARGYSDVEDD